MRGAKSFRCRCYRYCTFRCELSADIDFIYKDLTDNLPFCMSRYQLALIQQKILSGIYVLSPLQVKFIKMDDLSRFLHDTLPDCPDIMIGRGSDPDIRSVVLPSNKEDVLVLRGLSRMLLRLSQGNLLKDCDRLEILAESFFDSLQEMEKVDRLYRLDLIASLRFIPSSLILDKVKPLVGDGIVYKLISSLLSLPIIDEDGNHRSDISFGMPPVGEITKVLFNIVIKDLFDRSFSIRFPGLAFSRFMHEVFIFTSGNDEVFFNEKAVYGLLEELSLLGNIVSIGRGDDPLPCYYTKIIYLDSYGKVHVCNPIEYS